MESSKDVDVLVVGGGPAGLLAAETAASAGCSTLLVESEPEIAHQVRTSGATSVQTMREFQIPERLYHPLTQIRLCSTRETATFGYDEPIGCIIDVRGVFRYLAERADGAGASILTSAQAVAPTMVGQRVAGCEIKSKSDGDFSVRSKVLIDASGYRSGISTQAGLHQGFTRFGVGAEYELLAPHCDQDEAVLIVGGEHAPSGYAWVFPWGAGRVRVGVGILHGDSRANPKEYLDAFLDNTANFGVDLRDSEVVEYHHGLVPSDGLAHRCAGDGIMAVGDAAGQASLVVGEGIRLSMLAGRLAGQTAAKAIAGGSWDQDALLPYQEGFRSSYGRSLMIGHVMNERMGTWDDDRWDEIIRLIRTIPPRMFAKLLQSEFSSSDILPWIIRRPNLWPRAARYAAKVVFRRFRSA